MKRGQAEVNYDLFMEKKEKSDELIIENEDDDNIRI